MPDFTGYSIHQPASFGANSGWGVSDGISSIQDYGVDPRRSLADGGGVVTFGGIDETSGDETLVVNFGNPSGGDIIIPNEDEASGEYTISSTPTGYKLYAYTSDDNIDSIRVRFNGGAWSGSISGMGGGTPNSIEWDIFSIGYAGGTVEVELTSDSNGNTELDALLLVKDYTISESDLNNIPAGCVFFDPIADGDTQQYGGDYDRINDAVRWNDVSPTYSGGSIDCFTEGNLGQFIVAYNLTGSGSSRFNFGVPVNTTSMRVYFRPGDIDPKSVNLKWGNSWFTPITSYSAAPGGAGWKYAIFPDGQNLELPIGEVQIQFECNDTDGDDNEISAAYFEMCYSAGNSGGIIPPGVMAMLTMNSQTIRPPWL